jgi:hypothetical protein
MSPKETRTRRLVTVLFMIVISALLLPAPTMAAPTPPPPSPDGIAPPPTDKYNIRACKDSLGGECIVVWDWISMWTEVRAVNLEISLLKGVTRIFWLFPQIAYTASSYVVTDSFLDGIREAMVGQLTQIMPPILEEAVGGPSGLFVISLLLAGIFMTFPFLAQMQNIVSAPRVIGWMLLLSALFLFNTYGYDMIAGFEEIRLGLMRTAMGGSAESSGTGLYSLVTGPMRASAEDMETFFAFPPEFEEGFFPVDKATRELRVVIAENGLLDRLTKEPAEIETPESAANRMGAAWVGFAVVFIVGLISIVLILFAALFSVLAAAALLLIFFFIAALPLGFFELGGQILMSIGKQYMYVFALSLLGGALAQILAAFANNIGAEGDGWMAYIAILAPSYVIVLILVFAIKMAVETLRGSGTILLQAGRTAVGAPPVRRMQGGVGDTVRSGFGRVGGVGVAAATGAMLGGPATALMSATMAALSGAKGRDGANSAVAANLGRRGPGGSMMPTLPRGAGPIQADTVQADAVYVDTDPNAPPPDIAAPTQAGAAPPVANLSGGVMGAPLDTSGAAKKSPDEESTRPAHKIHPDAPDRLPDVLAGVINQQSGLGAPGVNVNDTSAMLALRQMQFSPEQNQALMRVATNVAASDTPTPEAYQQIYNELRQNDAFKAVSDFDLRKVAKQAYYYGNTSSLSDAG